MSTSDLSDLDRQVLDALSEAFPASQSPYCDIAAAIGAQEIDVLNSAMKLREMGVLGPIFAQFARPIADGGESADDDAILAVVLLQDLPWGEHPFAEVAAQLSLRGVDREEAWVLERLSGWLADGTIKRLAAEPI